MNWKAKVKKRFSHDIAAHKWDDMYKDKTQLLEEEFFRKRRDFTVSYVKNNYSKKSDLCDIGCGAGPVITELLKLEYNCIGLDYSPDMIRNAATRLKNNGLEQGVLLRGDCEALPFRSQQFDCVICLGVISYVDDYNNIIDEISRILKPNGTAIITYRNYYNPILSDPIALLKYVIKKILFMKDEDANEIGRFLKTRQVKKDISKHGLKLRKSLGIGFGPFCVNYKKLFRESTSIKIDNYLSYLTRIPGLSYLFRPALDINILIYEK